jgi:hypothetical protein
MSPYMNYQALRVEDAVEDLKKLAPKNWVVQAALFGQQMRGWSDVDTYAVIAVALCGAQGVLSERLKEAMSMQLVKPVEVVKADGKVVRHAFLPNAAREMYDALKLVVALFEPDAPFLIEKHGGRMTNGDQDKIDEVFRKVDEAIAKAEGRL